MKKNLSLFAAAAEAVLFVAQSPVSRDELGQVLGITEPAKIDEIIDLLAKRYSGDDRGIILQRVAGGVRLATVSSTEPYVVDYLQRTAPSRLSQAALETLAIIAYRQPVTQPEINAVRGVNSAGVVTNLLQKRLIRTAGRKNVVGRPFLYKTTKEFLIHFGLDSAQDLPPIEELTGHALE